MYRRFLGGQGFSAIAVHTAEEALARAHQADVIVCGLRLGSCTTGIQLIEAIRRNDGARVCPVIVLTAYKLAALRDRAIAAGCNRVLLKPCRFDVLLLAFREVLPESTA